MKKQGVNEKCNCGSGLKYKKCCMILTIDPPKYRLGQQSSSAKILNCMTLFSSLYPDHKMIDITDDLSVDTYRDYQLKNYTSNIVMFAEKTATNNSVFETRINNSNSDIIVMYHGAYRTFDFEQLDMVIHSVGAMIEGDAA